MSHLLIEGRSSLIKNPDREMVLRVGKQEFEILPSYLIHYITVALSISPNIFKLVFPSKQR